MNRLLTAIVLTFTLAVGTPAISQTQDEVASVFSGAWRVYDPAYVNGGPCTIALSRNTQAEAFVAEQAYCGGGLENVAGWGVERGQLVLLDAGFNSLARLGGNENRISGDMKDGSMVILQRTKPGDAEPVVPDCLYLGYTQDCATTADRAPLPTGNGPEVQAGTLVRLVLREQPRPDASVLSTVEPESCLAFSECRIASDGPWCRTNHQGVSAWVRRHAVRLGEFPVLTYRQGC